MTENSDMMNSCRGWSRFIEKPTSFVNRALLLCRGSTFPSPSTCGIDLLTALLSFLALMG